MNKRIRELRTRLGLTQREFAEHIGLKQTAISNMEKEGAKITDQTIRTICMQYGVCEEWLRTGAGKMLIETSIKQKEFFELFNQFSPVLQDYLLQTARALLEAQQKLEQKQTEQ